MNYETLVQKDRDNIIGTYGRYNVGIVSGRGAECRDSIGKRYLDFTAGIGVNVLGYSDPEWAEAVAGQAAKLQHTSNLFYSEPCTLLAEQLTAKTGFSKVFFSNSGAEANEGAIKAARKYSFDKYGSDRYEIITLENSFHGRTMATITATGQDGFHRFYTPFLEGFKYVPANDIQLLRSTATEKTCAIMMEMVQGEGGVIPLSRDFVKEVRAICDEKDIILIVDEVQTGVGRTGRFLSYEYFDIKPDIATIAKGLGGGLPIGAVLFGKKCETVFSAGDHGSTFGGNPVSCAGGLVVMKRLDEAFLSGVRERASYLADRIKAIPQVREVSGLGFMLGAVIDGRSAKDVVAACVERGLLILTAKERLRMLPPLIISKAEIDEAVDILSAVLG
ncbi:acetylornithine aminotransferase [Clostridia bacterium]|nr:acetylornithine aminotransferase [Clostridia bacterium]